MRIGILGAGQLGLLTAQAADPLGISVAAYAPSLSSREWSHRPHCLAAWDDWAALSRFAEASDVISVETENIPLATLEYLAARFDLRPNLTAVAIAQDRYQEKAFFNAHGIPCADWVLINTISDLTQAAEQLGFPFRLKTRLQGYDGKGQFCIPDWQSLQSINLSNSLMSSGSLGYIAEANIPFDREISVIGARNPQGDIVIYPIFENTHRDGVLQYSQLKTQDPMQALAEQYLREVLTAWDYVGVLTIEFFQCGQRLLANEMAPRVHNSGHVSLDACKTSQFENHVRAISGLSLASADPFDTLRHCIMHNILGEWPSLSTLLEKPGVRVYDYGKTPAPGRKLGHVTVCEY
jgi:5-(carboxyamino)imidazole ribonucleotide synthase